MIKSNNCLKCGASHRRIIKSESICESCYAKSRKTKCKELNCDNISWSRGYCSSHFKEFKNSGKIVVVPKGTLKLCTVEGCGSKNFSNGMCSKHYRRAKRRENPNFNPSMSPIERSKESFQFKSETQKIRSVKKANEKKLKREQKLSGPSISKTNGILKYTLDAHVLAKSADFQISNLKKVLNNLKDEGLIINFNYDKSLMIVEIFIDEYSELNFVYQESLGLTDTTNEQSF